MNNEFLMWGQNGACFCLGVEIADVGKCKVVVFCTICVRFVASFHLAWVFLVRKAPF